MKNNSFSLRSALSVLTAFLLMLVLFDACKKADDPVAVIDKTKLKARLDSANAGYALAVEGTQVGQFEAGSKAVFKTAVDAATTVNTNANATQAEVNNAYVNLGQAGVVFLSKQVQQIAPANLVLYLKMDGDAKDASGKGFDGMLKPGTSWGGGLPLLTKDRYGMDNKAYRFNKGSNIEIPYNPLLNPTKEVTVSVWAQIDSVWANNYMVSLNRWNGYKLQVQDTKRVFLTVKTANSIDKDDGTGVLTTKTWYHITTTYKSGAMNFYINGTLLKTYPDATGDLAPVKSNINLVVGQDLPNSVYLEGDANKDNNADGNNFYRPYGGYFIGALDEVRIYNVALSDTQVKSIYNAEKP